jgi:hypothetical protein
MVIAAVAVAGAAAAVHFRERPNEAASTERATPPKPQTPSQAKFVVEPRGQLLNAARSDLFAVPWTPPAPQPAIAAVALEPEPSRPAFPYRYGGWLDAGSGAGHVFVKGSHALPGIKVGEMLDGVWRLDALSGDRVEVSFLPKGQQLSMSLASLTGDATAQFGPSSGARVAGGFVPVQAVVAASPATGASTSPMQPGPAPSDAMPTSPALSGRMPSSPAPSGRLGIDAPHSGSIPTGPAEAKGPAPGGKLGTEPTARGKLGTGPKHDESSKPPPLK